MWWIFHVDLISSTSKENETHLIEMIIIVKNAQNFHLYLILWNTQKLMNPPT